MQSYKVKVIAECGVNHNGDPSLAKEMIDVAYEAGADFVKFQTYQTDQLLKKECPMAQYQIENLGENKSQYEMLKQYELSEAQFHALYEYSQKKGIAFLSTPFDLFSLELLIQLGMKTIKISSGDLTNAPLLMMAAQKGLNIILSTGMASIEEIDAALAVLHWGYQYADRMPTSLRELLNEAPKNFSHTLYDRVCLLHCLSDYPAPAEHVNLRAIQTLSKRYSLEVGFSDHTLGDHIACAAIALGAGVVEKHFTLNPNFPGPDHKASLAPKDLIKFIQNVRDVERALGDGVKQARGKEVETAQLVRKGLYAKNFIAKHQVIREEDLLCLRPAARYTPLFYWDHINKPAEQEYQPGEPL